MKRECMNGKLLRIDLSTGRISMEPAIDYNKRFLGGRGVNHWLLLREMRSDISPLDPESVILFGTGALSGTPAPGSSRLHMAAKNPLTGGIGSGSGGGFFAPELRFAGFDTVMVTGRAQKPSYVWIQNEHVSLRDAQHLWGRTTWDTIDLIRKEFQDCGL